MSEITEQEFKIMVGRKPIQDDLHRVNCEDAGAIGHFMCGLCPKCNKPRFICGHLTGASS